MKTKILKSLITPILGLSAIGTIAITSTSCGASAVTGIELDQRELELKVGEEAKLTATVLPENAANKEVTWESSNKEVATVDKNGKVTAINPGYADIAVTTADGGYKAGCSVKVREKSGETVSVTGVKLSRAKTQLTVNGTNSIWAMVLPENATDQRVTWESDNQNVVSVSGDWTKATVKGLRSGSATITVTTVDGGYKATCIVTVVAE